MPRRGAPRSPDGKPLALAFCAWVADASGRYLLLRRAAASAHFPDLWETPGGKANPGEAFDAALLREVREETGLEVTLLGPAGVTDIDLPHARVVLLFMWARARSTHITLSREHEDSVWLRPCDFGSVALAPSVRGVLNAVDFVNGKAVKHA